MPKGGSCMVCSRPDADLLRAMVVEQGLSGRQVAIRHGIHPRVFNQHLKKHSKDPIGQRRRGRKSAESQNRTLQAFTVAGEAKALLNKVAAVLQAAEASSSHALVLQGVREAKGLLDLLGRTTGELSTPGQTTVNVALGVSIEEAKRTVEMVEQAEALSPSELVDRAVEVLRMWNAEHPEDMRII